MYRYTYSKKKYVFCFIVISHALMVYIGSIEDVKKAVESWEFPLDKVELISQAFTEIKKQKAIQEANFIPELEKDNFRIDSSTWKEIVSPNGVRVKENPEEDVWEFLEGPYIGEQFFKYKAAIRETKKAGKQMPYVWEVYKNMLEKKYQWNYEAFFAAENIQFCGWRNQLTKTFDNIDQEFSMWCEDAGFFTGKRDWSWHCTYWDRGFGLSVRCLKIVQEK